MAPRTTTTPPWPNPYHCKNGPLESIEELLLVQGVTPQLLFGNDRNRNGVIDPDEDDGSGQADLGWSQYLTVYSREPNTDYFGNPRIYINDPDINTMATNLSPVLGDDMTNFIVAYRLYGAASAGGGTATVITANNGAFTATTVSAPTAPTNNTTTPFKALGDDDANSVRTALQSARTPAAQSNNGQQTQQLKQISSVYDLVNASVNVPTGSGNSAKTISLPSPLNDPGQLPTLLPLVLDETTTTLNTDLTPRININTAPQTVLNALEAVLGGTASPSPTGVSAAPTDTSAQLTDEDIQMILQTRPDPSSDQSPDPSFQTPAWLVTQANFPVAKLKALEPYINDARSQVLPASSRFGYFQGTNGPVARIEAIVDGNNGNPRIIYERDLTSLGPGFDMNQLTAGQ